MQDVPISEESFDVWACRVTASERSWEHTRRKRRLAQQIALERAKGKDGECIGANTAEETSIKTGNDVKSTHEGSSGKQLPDKDGPLLVCKLWVEAESRDDSEDVITRPEELLRIWMIFENGHGGLDALHSLRQYLINKLGVREKILDNPSKFKRKKKRKNADGRVSTAVAAGQQEGFGEQQDAKKFRKSELDRRM